MTTLSPRILEPTILCIGLDPNHLYGGKTKLVNGDGPMLNNNKVTPQKDSNRETGGEQTHSNEVKQGQTEDHNKKMRGDLATYNEAKVQRERRLRQRQINCEEQAQKMSDLVMDEKERLSLSTYKSRATSRQASPSVHRKGSQGALSNEDHVTSDVTRDSFMSDTSSVNKKEFTKSAGSSKPIMEQTEPRGTEEKTDGTTTSNVPAGKTVGERSAGYTACGSKANGNKTNPQPPHEQSSIETTEGTKSATEQIHKSEGTFKNGNSGSRNNVNVHVNVELITTEEKVLHVNPDPHVLTPVDGGTSRGQETGSHGDMQIPSTSSATDSDRRKRPHRKKKSSQEKK